MRESGKLQNFRAELMSGDIGRDSLCAVALGQKRTISRIFWSTAPHSAGQDSLRESRKLQNFRAELMSGDIGRDSLCAVALGPGLRSCKLTCGIHSFLVFFGWRGSSVELHN